MSKNAVIHLVLGGGIFCLISFPAVSFRQNPPHLPDFLSESVEKFFVILPHNML